MTLRRFESKTVLLLFAMGMVAFLAISVVSNLRNKTPQPPQLDAGMVADAELKAFSFVRTREGDAPLILNATKGVLFESNQTARLENITATIPYGEGHAFRIDGETGEIDSEKKNFSVRNHSGPISIALENQYTVLTSGLIWDEDQRTLFSEGPVHISGPQTEIDGDTLRILVDEQEMVILGDVKALVK